jgi:NAD-dependent deacetylase
VFPAAEIPVVAKEHGAKIIEINIEETHFTRELTDIFLRGKASEMMKGIGELLYL